MNNDGALGVIGSGVEVYYSKVSNFIDQNTYKLLSQDELARSKNFRRTADRQMFISARSSLRKLLSQYLRIPADKVEFSYGSNGKPYLKGRQQLYFNVAHSTGIFVIAISTIGEVGVDIESRNRLIDVNKLSSFLLSSEENDRLDQTPEKRRQDLIRCWVLKESVVKAFGVGLTEPVKELEIEFMNGDCVIQKTWSWADPQEWNIKQLSISDDHECAVTFRAEGLNNNISKVVKIKELE